MQRRKILIVSNAFFPENSPRSFRTTELAKEFGRQGHEVTVLTHKKREQEAVEKEFNILIKDLGTPGWKPIVVKGTGLVNLIRRGLSRVLGLFFEYPNIQLVRMVSKALQEETGYDLLISIAVPFPVHWGVASARTDKHPIAKIWAADCGDPYMGQENDTFKPPFYFGYVEKWFCRKADYLTVPTQGAIKAYYPEFRDKIRVIPQGFRFEDVEIYKGDVVSSKPVFGYAGSFIPGRRDPSEMLDYLVRLDLDFEFHIYTKTVHLVEPFLERSNGRIQLHDYIPRHELLYKFSQMDFVVNFENVGSRQSPSKLIDYAIIQKPILSIRTGFFEKEILDQFLKGDYSNQYTLENRDQFRIERIARQFIELGSLDKSVP